MIDGFYKPFHQNIEETLEHAERAKGERELGIEESTGKRIIARMGRYGPMVQIGDATDEEKPRFAKLKSGQSIETITLNEAMDLFQLPKTLGEFDGQEISVHIGRFGPYIKFGEQFISLPKGEEPLDVDLERAQVLIAEKQHADAPIAIYHDAPVTKGKGRFGPFIKWNNMFINIPRKYNYDALSKNDIEELIEAKMEKEANRFIQQWPAEKISIENGRWGPFIRFGKQMLKLGKKADGSKFEAQDLQEVSLEDVKKMIEAQVPGAFDKKSKKPAAKKSAKPAVKKAAKKKA
jgi:DNA topoisomerase-1